MTEGAGEPRLEDFGITEEDLARAPCLLLAEHRPTVLAAAYLVAAAAVFAAILHTGRSFPVATLFTVITMAAGSILLLPLLVAAQCASERAEEHWLCGRFPKLRACLTYRRAVAEHARQRLAAAAAEPETEWWAGAPQPAFVAAVGARLARHPDLRVSALDRERTGADLALESSNGSVLVRCEPGPSPIGAGVGRELVAAMTEYGAARAVIVSAADPAPALAEAIVGRAITVVPPWQLEGEFGIRNSQSTPREDPARAGGIPNS